MDIMNLKTIAFTGLLYLFPIERTYAKLPTLGNELKDLAELAMKCGKKASFEDSGSQNGVSGRYRVDKYTLDIPVIPDGNKNLGLPFSETISFHFRDGSVQMAPNRVIDETESVEVIGGGVGYFRCTYQRKRSSPGSTCTAPFMNDSLEARIRKAIKFIKENAPTHCYGENNFPCV